MPLRSAVTRVRAGASQRASSASDPVHCHWPRELPSASSTARWGASRSPWAQIRATRASRQSGRADTSSSAGTDSCGRASRRLIWLVARPLRAGRACGRDACSAAAFFPAAGRASSRMLPASRNSSGRSASAACRRSRAASSRRRAKSSNSSVSRAQVAASSGRTRRSSSVTPGQASRLRVVSSRQMNMFSRCSCNLACTLGGSRTKWSRMSSRLGQMAKIWRAVLGPMPGTSGHWAGVTPFSAVKSASLTSFSSLEAGSHM